MYCTRFAHVWQISKYSFVTTLFPHLSTPSPHLHISLSQFLAGAGALILARSENVKWVGAEGLKPICHKGVLKNQTTRFI